eukprot:1193892-Prorocentrum_minimum.AAC.1
MGGSRHYAICSGRESKLELVHAEVMNITLADVAQITRGGLLSHFTCSPQAFKYIDTICRLETSGIWSGPTAVTRMMRGKLSKMHRYPHDSPCPKHLTLYMPHHEHVNI